MIAAISTKSSALHSALRDPVFLVCLCSAARNPALLSEFGGLAGRNLQLCDLVQDLATNDTLACWAGDFMRFVSFVHTCIYMRLDPQVRTDVGAALLRAGRMSEALLLN